MQSFLLQSLPPETTEIVRNNYQIILLSLIIYSGLFIGITLLARRNAVRDLTDFSVASRDLGVVITTLTLFATVNSGVGLVGFPGDVSVSGASFTLMTMVGYSLGSFLIWYFGRRIWILGKEYNYNTPGDLLGSYYQSDTMRIYTVLVSLTFNIVYTVAQLVAGGILVNVLSGGLISPSIGTGVIAVIIALHTIVSGVRGIAWIDSLNGSIMIVVLTLFVGFIYIDAGGFSGVMAGLGDLQSEFVSTPGPVDAFPTLNIYGTGIGFLVSLVVMTPAAWLRFYSSSSKNNFVGLGIGILVVFVIVNLSIFWIGAYGAVLFPNVENTDYISSLVAFEVLPIPIAAAFLIAILAGIISTTDSYIHALSVTTGRDFVRAILKDDLTEEAELVINYGIVVLTAIISVIIALSYTGVIVPLAVFGSGIALHMMPATFGAVSWPRASNEAALIATPVGLILSFIWELEIITNPLANIGLRGLFVAFIVNIVLFVGISFVTKPPSEEQIEKHHGLLKRRL